MISRPDPSEYPAYFSLYIDKVPEGDVIALMEQQMEEIRRFFGQMTAEQADYRYAPGKWSIKEILGHLLDGERIFAYRALRFARNDITDLPGFDQDTYVAFGNFQARTMENLLAEYIPLRQSNIVLIKSFSDEVVKRSGTADGRQVSVRALPYVMVGHVIHHITMIRERYGTG